MTLEEKLLKKMANDFQIEFRLRKNGKKIRIFTRGNRVYIMQNNRNMSMARSIEGVRWLMEMLHQGSVFHLNIVLALLEF